MRHLSEHLELYGIALSVDNIGSSELGKQLRMLGLILDSPDAESGILLEFRPSAFEQERGDSMTGIAGAIAQEVSSTIATQLRNLNSQQAELRAVFNGPPQEFLTDVYELFS